MALPAIIPGHSVSYQPGVSVGQTIQYEPVYVTWTSSDPSILEPEIYKNINATKFYSLDVTEITGTNVTLLFTVFYDDGTSTSSGLSVDLDTGLVNDTRTPFTLYGEYVLLAGMLQKPDTIWSITGSPSLNLTLTESILGVDRGVNFLNFTGVVPGSSVVYSPGFAWDQQSGALVEISDSISVHGPGGIAQGSYHIAITDTDIWSPPSSLPDFSIATDPLTINAHQGSSGNATIMLTSINGFADMVSLTVVSPSTSLACTLSATTVNLNPMGSNTSTLSCFGTLGNYTAVVIGTNTSGVYILHSSPVAISISDFTIHLDQGSMTLTSDRAGTATITLTGLNGFSDAITLTVNSTPQGLVCTVNPTDLAKPNMAILSCNGEPGTYTVAVTATSGHTTHQAIESVQVDSAPASPQLTSYLTLPLVYAGIAIAIGTVSAVSFLLARKRNPAQ